MSGCKCNISVIIVLVSLFQIQAFSQQINNGDGFPVDNSREVTLKPNLNYSIGSSFFAISHLGSITGFTLSPSISVPLSPKLSVEGGIIAGRFYSSIYNLNSEGGMIGAFNELSVFGSANYHFNSRLTLYGIGIKQLTGTSPSYFLPKSSYTIGSTYNFGNFSIGVALQMSNLNNTYSPFPVNGSQGFYSPYGPIPGSLSPLP